MENRREEKEKQIKEMEEGLENFLHENGMYPGEEAITQREKAINCLDNIISKWGKKIYIMETGSQETDVRAATTRTYGSYRLGVFSSTADIDCCVITNNKISRRRHFLIDLFEELKNDPDVKNLKKIESAAPIITMEYMGVEIDLNFCKTQLNNLPENMDVLDEEIMQGMKKKSIRAINGRRSTDMILKFVGDVFLNKFRLMVRTLKIWTKRRGIYEFKSCFLNGIAIEITAAKIIKSHYEMNIIELLKEYFETYLNWDYQRNPIYLETSATDRVERKKDEVIQIITPAVPRGTCSNSITKSSLQLIKGEMKRGLDFMNKALQEGSIDWKTFFKKRHLFCRYYVFIEFILSPKDEDISFEEFEIATQKFHSNFMHLMKLLDDDPNIIEATVLPTSFNDEENNSIYFYVGLKVVDDVVVDISALVNSHLERRESQKDAVYNIEISIKKRSEIQERFAHSIMKKDTDENEKKLKEELKELQKELKKEED